MPQTLAAIAGQQTVIMRPEETKDLTTFLAELQRESDRGLPLVGTAFIDQKLRDTLESLFIEDKVANRLLDDANSPLGTFSSRLDCCYALGLINAYEHSEINLLRKVRNEFAHAKHGISFKSQRIMAFCSTLKSDLPLGAGHPVNDARFRFINAVICIILRLYYRPEWVAKERRSTKSYGEDGGKWISINEQPPPEGVDVIVILNSKKSPLNYDTQDKL